MRYGKRSPWKRIIASPISLVVMAIVVSVLSKATWNIYEKAVVSNDRLELAVAELERMKERQSDLSEKVTLLSTDQGVEAEIRTKFHALGMVSQWQ